VAVTRDAGVSAGGSGLAGPHGLLGYQYVVLRCVPRVDREEFLNVGVVLYCQSADYLCAATRLDRTRLQLAFPALDLDSVAEGLAAIEQFCKGKSPAVAGDRESLGQRFGWLAAPRSTVIQPGPIHGGLTSDPPVQLARLADSLTGGGRG
jgi:hypothetical protein